MHHGTGAEKQALCLDANRGEQWRHVTIGEKFACLLHANSH